MEPKDSQIENRESFLPNFCNVRFLLLLLIASELMAIVLTINQSTMDNKIWDDLSLTSLFMLWVTLMSAALLCLLRPVLNRLSNIATSIISYLLVLLVTLIISLSTTYLVQKYELTIFFDSKWAELFILKNLIISAIIGAVILRYFFVQHQWRLNQRSEARTRLKALEARIRPHFLFNSMNTIASLIHDQPDTAEHTVENLAELFRVSLQENNEHKLSDEISLVRSYLEIEELRLGGRLKAEWAVEKFENDIQIPALCLQPLVENAIYHGVEPQRGGGTIKIRIYKHNKRIIISVSNPSVGAKQSVYRHKGNRMAMNNIRQRLQLSYGDEAVFTIDEGPPLYTVTINIPYTEK